MRLKNVKGAKEIIEKGTYYIDNPYELIGSWQNVFKNNNPIYIEIGMGKGDFIIKNALQFPNINFIGIEKFDSVIVRAIQKSNELDIENLKLIRMDAERIDEVFANEVSKLYLNFSDPWPKDRHAKRRLTSPKFLSTYDKIFKNNIANIEMKTDNTPLFNYSVTTLKENGYNITYLTNDLHRENVFNITTEYEEKFSKKGIKINKLEAFKKID